MLSSNEDTKPFPQQGGLHESLGDAGTKGGAASNKTGHDREIELSRSKSLIDVLEGRTSGESNVRGATSQAREQGRQKEQVDEIWSRHAEGSRRGRRVELGRLVNQSVELRQLR